MAKMARTSFFRTALRRRIGIIFASGSPLSVFFDAGVRPPGAFQVEGGQQQGAGAAGTFG